MSAPINRTELAQAINIDLPAVDAHNTELLDRLAPAGRPAAALDAAAVHEVANLVGTDPSAAGAVIANALYRLDAQHSLALIQQLNANVAGGLAALPRAALLSVNAELATHTISLLIDQIPMTGRVVEKTTALSMLLDGLRNHAQANAGRLDSTMAQDVETALKTLETVPDVGNLNDFLRQLVQKENATRDIADVAKEYWVARMRGSIAQNVDDATLAIQAPELLHAVAAVKSFQEWSAAEGLTATAEQRAARFKKLADELHTLTPSLTSGLEPPGGQDLSKTLRSMKKVPVRNLR